MNKNKGLGQRVWKNSKIAQELRTKKKDYDRDLGLIKRLLRNLKQK